MASAVGEKLDLLEANELYLRFHGTHHDFKEHLAVLASQHLGLTFTPPSQNERDRKMADSSRSACAPRPSGRRSERLSAPRSESRS